MAELLQQMNMGGGQLSPWQQQDEQDRRWQNMSYEIDQLRQQERYPKTGGEFQDLIIKHGLKPHQPLTPAMAQQPMAFDKFMNLCGNRGWSLMAQYEAQGQPDAPRKCDGCSLRGARMRCSNCGETYCSSTCQKKEWKDHRKICCMAGRAEPRTMPRLMTWDDYDVKVLGKRKTASKPSGRAATATAPSPVTPPTLGSQGPSYSEIAKRDDAEKVPGKNAKKNAKKREKAKAAKAQAVNVSEEKVVVAEPLPAYADVD